MSFCESDDEFSSYSSSPTLQLPGNLALQSNKNTAQVLPLDCFYKTVLQDLLLSRNDSFFNYLFSQIFSRRVKARLNDKELKYEELRQHFSQLRKAYYATFSSDAILDFGPFLTSSYNGGREGYVAAQMVMGTFSSQSQESESEQEDSCSSSKSSPSHVAVADTLEVQWVEGKDGEVRRISRFDRTTSPVTPTAEKSAYILH